MMLSGGNNIAGLFYSHLQPFPKKIKKQIH